LRKNIFKKAHYFKDKIEKISETDRAVIFKVGENEVRVFYKGIDLFYNCTCMFGSIKPNKLCSHKLAVIYKLIDENN